jgi:RHS repeat-associated protein
MLSANGTQRLLLSPTRIYDPATGRFLQRDPFERSDPLAVSVVRKTFLQNTSLDNEKSADPNSYAYVANSPIVLSDPIGLDWYEAAADFAAGAGDSLTFGVTGWLRQKWGIDDVVNKCSGWYTAGEWTEVGAELLLTGGSSLLKGAAKRAGKALIEKEVKAMTGKVVRAAGQELHHINPLVGQPVNLTRGRVVLTLFPMGGLPAWIHSGKWNWKLLTYGEHMAAHRRLIRAETVAKTVVNPATTFARGARDRVSSCDCKK